MAADFYDIKGKVWKSCRYLKNSSHRVRVNNDEKRLIMHQEKAHHYGDISPLCEESKGREGNEDRFALLTKHKANTSEVS